MPTLLWALLITIGTPSLHAQQALPEQFDLRVHAVHNPVTAVKSQQGGTCWTHGTMAALESNLLITGVWDSLLTTGDETEHAPNLAEYHLDWWNGFNAFYNEDTPGQHLGLEIHMGGDYRVASAYISRGEGVVRDTDGQNFDEAPMRRNTRFHYFYPRDIEWYSAGAEGEQRDLLKEKIMEHGVMATCLYYNASFIDSNYCHYQPPSDHHEPNHSVAIIGWDDTRETQAPLPGAWLVKNSWSQGWGHQGYFWIAYGDKWTGRHPEMGAVSFLHTEPMQYDHVYYHDYHGWRDTLTTAVQGFNAFTATQDESLEAVSFYTAADSVDFTLAVYSQFAEGELAGLNSTQTGFIRHSGFHTVTLDEAPALAEGQRFFLYLSLSAGGQAIDRSSIVPVLLGATGSSQFVPSTAAPGQSYIMTAQGWADLYDAYQPDNADWSQTANLCIKGLTKRQTPTTVNNGAESSVTAFSLGQNYPNPFNPTTTIPCRIAASCRVQVVVYSSLGQVVRQLYHNETAAGTLLLEWDGCLDNGMPAASGMYFIKMTSAQHSTVRKVLLLR